MSGSIAETAMRRVADAILVGDYMTPMAETSPEVLMQVMQIGGSMMNLPPPERYDLEVLGEANGLHSFRITFRAGDQALSATVGWQELEGFWRITSITDVVAPGF